MACLTGRESEVHGETVLHSTGEGGAQIRTQAGLPMLNSDSLSGLHFAFWKEECLQQHPCLAHSFPNTAFISYFNLESVWNPQKFLGVSASSSVKPDISH